MGYMRHHAIVVTANGYPRAADCLVQAHAQAVSRNLTVSAIVRSPANECTSFAVFPDGSKEGWETSNHGNDARADFIAWLDTIRYGDTSTPLHWVEMQYGDDDHQTLITAHDDEPHRQKPGLL